MNKLDSIENIRKYFKNDHFAVALGFYIEEGAPGCSRISVNIAKNHMNGVNIPHGGFLFSLADFAGAVATNSYGFVSLSIDSSITYINQGKGQQLIAVAKEISRSKRITNIEMNIYDNLDTHIACARGTYYITQKEIDLI